MGSNLTAGPPTDRSPIIHWCNALQLEALTSAGSFFEYSIHYIAPFVALKQPLTLTCCLRLLPITSNRVNSIQHKSAHSRTEHLQLVAQHQLNRRSSSLTGTPQNQHLVDFSPLSTELFLSCALKFEQPQHSR